MSDQFGESVYGPRLDFNNRRCRDPLCAVIYYLHIIGVVIATIYIFVYYYDEIADEVDNITPSPGTIDPDSLDWTGVYVTIPVCAI